MQGSTDFFTPTLKAQPSLCRVMISLGNQNMPSCWPAENQTHVHFRFCSHTQSALRVLCAGCARRHVGEKLGMIHMFQALALARGFRISFFSGDVSCPHGLNIGPHGMEGKQRGWEVPQHRKEHTHLLLHWYHSCCPKCFTSACPVTSLNAALPATCSGACGCGGQIYEYWA